MYIMHADPVFFPSRQTGTQNSSPADIKYETTNTTPPPVIKYLGQIGDLPHSFGALLTKTTYICRGRILGPGPAAGEKYWVSVHYIHLWLK